VSTIPIVLHCCADRVMFLMTQTMRVYGPAMKAMLYPVVRFPCVTAVVFPAARAETPRVGDEPLVAHRPVIVLELIL